MDEVILLNCMKDDYEFDYNIVLFKMQNKIAIVKYKTNIVEKKRTNLKELQ